LPPGPRAARPLGLRMDGSDEANEVDQAALWASLRKRMGPLPHSLTGDSLGHLPTADKMSPNDVVTVVLRALMAKDEPWEGHGTEILMAYSSPTAKDTQPAMFATPEALGKALSMNEYTCMAMDVHDFRFEEERCLNQNTLILIRTSVQVSSGEWQTLCFALSRAGNRWMIDDMGRAAV